MSAEVAAWAPQSTALADYSGRAVQRLGEWAQSATAAYAIAERLVESSFVPAQFKGKPVEAAAAILAGVEVGLQPMASLRSFDIIQGTAAARALTLRAIVQSHGHEIQQVEATSSRCVMQGRRRGSQDWQKVTWTIDRARELGLTGKDNWKKQPQAMLVARATSEIARLIAADAILGIGYSVEEIQDGADDNYTAGEPGVARTTRTLSRKPAEAAETANEPESGDSITAPQSKKLHALVNEHGMDRDAKLAFASGVVGWDVQSTNDLSKAQAALVIDALETPAEVVEAEQPAPATDEQIAAIKEWVGIAEFSAPAAKAMIRRVTDRGDATTANLTGYEAEAVLAELRSEPAAEPAPEDEVR